MKKLSITITVLAMAGGVQVASASNFCAAVNDLNPVGYWQFEQDWTDRSGNGNTLTPFALSEGPVTFTPGPGHAGMPGDAADFRHGGGQRGAYVDTGAGDPLTLSGAGGYTINAWVSNDEDLGSWGFIAVERDAGWCCGPNGWNYGLAYYRSLGGPQSGYKTWIQGSNASVEPVPIIDADWHMLTVSATLPSGTASIYLDGVFAGSHATGGASMAGDGEYFQVGNPINPITNAAVPENYTSNDLNGRIDELAVFGSALSAQDIAGLYAAAQVPEPTTLALLGLGSLAFLRNRRRG
jgi:hypothetical protein